MAPYADNYFEYDTSHRVSKEIAQGEGCSSCAGGLGTFTYSYTSSGNAAGYNSWAMKTVEGLPDGNTETVYTNAYGEVMLSVYTDATSGLTAGTPSTSTTAGPGHPPADPSAVTGYNDAYADLLHNVSGNYQYLSNTSGLITLTDYYATTTATETTAGGVAGYQQDVKLEQGPAGHADPARALAILHAHGGRRPRSTRWRRTPSTATPTAPARETTSYAYTWYAGTAQMQSETDDAAGHLVGAKWAGHGRRDDGGASTFTAALSGRRTPTATSLTRPTTRPPGRWSKTIDDVNTADTRRVHQPADGLDDADGRRPGTRSRNTSWTRWAGRRRRSSPDGNITYTVYLDRASRGRASTRAGTPRRELPTGPTEVIREDQADGYTEIVHHVGRAAPDGRRARRHRGDQRLANAVARLRQRSWAGHTSDYYFNLSGLTYTTAVMGAWASTTTRRCTATTAAGGKTAWSARRGRSPHGLRRPGAVDECLGGHQRHAGERLLVADEQHRLGQHGGNGQLPLRRLRQRERERFRVRERLRFGQRQRKWLRQRQRKWFR